MTEKTDLSVHLWKPCRPEEFVKDVRDILDWVSSELDVTEFQGKVECLEMGGEDWPGIAVVLELHNIPFAMIMSTSESHLVCMKRTKDMESLMIEQSLDGINKKSEPRTEAEAAEAEDHYEPPLPPLHTKN